MSVREGLNSKPGAGVVVAVVCVLLGGWAIFHQLRPTPDAQVTQVYYSDDDGTSWFTDTPDKICPFDHNGKQAVRCFFAKINGKVSVAYLRKSSPDLADRLKHNLPVGQSDFSAGMLVKRPGDTGWMPSGDPKAQALISSTSPDDSGDEVTP